MKKTADREPIDRETPSGTVTFLFTDIEGSTRLLEGLREQYAILLEEQQQILRLAFSHWNGKEIDTQGDSFFAVFPRAIDALCCVMEAQREIASHDWPQDSTVRVRMGLHTGEPIQVRAGYIGMDVHRAARIASAGHGGQVLLSQSTRELVYSDLPKGVSLRDLGQHKLKDIRFPQTLFQLDIEGLPCEFPPLKTLSVELEPPTPGEAPYKGLQHFDEPDAQWFFGRDNVSHQLAQAVQEQRFLAVIGASGSGKSSVVRAGLVPVLKRSQLSRWLVHILTPTSHPLESMALSLTRHQESVTAAATLIDDLLSDPRSLHLYILKALASKLGDRHTAEGKSTISHPGREDECQILLVVDQFEELFTQCREEGERLSFIDNLLYAANAEDGPTRVVITLRADFYQHLAQYPGLRAEIAKHQEYLGAMDADELRQAIEEPARHGGWEFSPGLVELFLHDIGIAEGRQPEPGALPLLSHALLETWKRRRANLMNLKAYAEAGGVRGAIARTAESVYYGELTPEQQKIARNIFLRLTELGEGTQDTRRRVAINELTPPAPYGNPKTVHEVLVKLADARLITTGEGTAEVAHEALIREWPTLRRWLTEDREGLLVHRRLTEASQEWELLEDDAGVLFRGARLAQAIEWAQVNPQLLNAKEKAFLDASQQASEREEREREEQAQRELAAAQRLADTQTIAASKLKRRAWLLAGAMTLAIFLAAAALFLGNQASQRANLAVSRELAAAAVNNLHVDPERSVLLALQALATANTLEAVNSLHQALPELHIMHTIDAHPIAPGIAINKDGSRLASVGSNGDIKIWDASTYEQLRMIPGEPGENVASNIEFSPDGLLLASTTLSKVILWDAFTGEKIQTWAGDLSGSQLSTIRFSPDGEYLAISNLNNVPAIYDLSKRTIALSLTGHAAICDGIAYSSDSERLATVDQSGVIKNWNSHTGQELLSINQGGLLHSVTFSPDGSRLAAAGEEGIIKLWDSNTGELLLTIPRQTGIYNLAFMPGGVNLVAVHQDGQVDIWDSITGVKQLTLAGHQSTVLGLAVSPQGDRVITSGYDGKVKIWDAVPGKEVQTLVGNSGSFYDVAFSNDGSQLFTAGQDGSVIIWDAKSYKKISTLINPGESKEISRLRLSPDGEFLAIGSLGGEIHLWNNATRKNVWKVQAHDAEIYGLAFSADNQRLVSAGWEGSIKVWDRKSSKEISRIDGLGIISLFDIDVSHDGKFIYSANAFDQGHVYVWNAESGKEVERLSGMGHDVYGIAISPDGRFLAVGWDNGYITIWDLIQEEKIQEFSAHAGLIVRLDFNQDGTHIASVGFDKLAKVWDIKTGQEIATMYGHGSNIFGVSFSVDGKLVATAGGDGTIRIYTSQIDDLINLAHSRLTRTLSEEECQKYLHLSQCPEL